MTIATLFGFYGLRPQVKERGSLGRPRRSGFTSFHNEANGFCVLRVKARGHRDLATIVGQAATISAGEWITASGEWVNDRTHGLQFQTRFLKTSPSTAIDGIQKYLGSSMVPGIGPVYAKKLVQAFGEKVSY